MPSLRPWYRQGAVPKLSMLLVAAVLASLLGAGGSAIAGSPQQPPVTGQTTALLVTSTNAPLRVLGSDGLEHLEYDLVFTNLFTAPVTLTSIDVLGPDGSELLQLAGEALAANTQPVFAGAPSAVVPEAGTVATVIDLTLAADQVPAQITHRINYDLPADAPALSLIGSRTLTGPDLTVDPRLPLVVAAPLRGDGWLSANGCCLADTPHRFTRLAVDGAHYVKPETFAIDWFQLRGGRLFTGDGSRNEQWFCYGAELLSVAAGTVVSTRDGMPEETPYQPPMAVHQPADYGGNYVVVLIQPGVYAFYAHLQPDSLRVRVGDRVVAGQVLGLLGNSGNSTAPHLHFQLSDGADVLTSTSLPFEFAAYTLAGSVSVEALGAALSGSGSIESEEPLLASGTALPVAGASEIPLLGTPQAQSGTHPLVLTVQDFP